MSYYTIFSTIFQCQNMNNTKIPEQHRTKGAIRGLFLFFAKYKHYLPLILSRTDRGFIVNFNRSKNTSTQQIRIGLFPCNNDRSVKSCFFGKHSNCFFEICPQKHLTFWGHLKFMGFYFNSLTGFFAAKRTLLSAFFIAGGSLPQIQPKSYGYAKAPFLAKYRKDSMAILQEKVKEWNTSGA